MSGAPIAEGAVAQAMELMRRLCELTPREQAEARLRKAKAMMTAASEAVLSGDPEAADLGDRALIELEAARRALARLDAEAAGE